MIKEAHPVAAACVCATRLGRLGEPLIHFFLVSEQLLEARALVYALEMRRDVEEAERFTADWVALQQLTGLLADGTWVPMATVHFAAVTAALLAAWIAARAKDEWF
jgi:hypothetical protein